MLKSFSKCFISALYLCLTLPITVDRNLGANAVMVLLIGMACLSAYESKIESVVFD